MLRRSLNPRSKDVKAGRAALSAPQPRVGKQMQRIVLRESGIYALPDGREFVVHAVFRDRYVLYTSGAWEFFGIHAYESDVAGLLGLNGRPTYWRVGNLTDTTRTAHSRSRNNAEAKAVDWLNREKLI